MKLTLVGSNHFNAFDSENRERLDNILSEERPDFVTLEADSAAVDILQTHEYPIMQHFQNLGLKADEEVLPFMYMQIGESMHVIRHCVQRDIPYQPVDIPGFREPLVRRNLSYFFSLDSREQYLSIKENATQQIPHERYSLDSPELYEAFEVADPEYMLRERDAYMEGFIKGIASEYLGSDDHLLHTGGIIHLLDVEDSLYDNLREYEPRRIEL